MTQYEGVAVGGNDWYEVADIEQRHNEVAPKPVHDIRATQMAWRGDKALAARGLNPTAIAGQLDVSVPLHYPYLPALRPRPNGGLQRKS